MGTFLAVQWLRFYASSSGGTGSVPGQGTKIPHATQHGKKKKKKYLLNCCSVLGKTITMTLNVHATEVINK